MNAQERALSSEDEELCVAGLEDYHSVMDIDRDVYCGLDDLPEKYPSLVSGPDVRGYIYKKQGRVVGFLSTEILDGGQTLFITAGRITPSFRGRGMFGRFTRRVFQEFSGSCGLGHVAMTVDNVNMANYGDVLLKSYRKILEMRVFDLLVNIPAVKRTLHTQAPQNIHLKQLAPSDIRDMMRSDPSRLRHLFPEGRILLCSHWKAYRIMEDNTERVLDSNTFLVTCRDAEVVNHNSCITSYCDISLMTCASYYTSKKGLNYDVNIFGAGSDKEVRTQLSWHLQKLVSLTEEEEAILCILCPERFVKTIEKLKDSLPIAHVFPFEKEILLERDFPTGLPDTS